MSVKAAAAWLEGRTVPWTVTTVVAVVALLVGAWLGNSTHFGAKNLTVLTGEARLHNTDNWLTSFDTGDPDEQLSFYANAVSWTDGTFGGDGGAPCLRVGEVADVRVGYTHVDFPDGGSRPVVAWVECLATPAE